MIVSIGIGSRDGVASTVSTTGSSSDLDSSFTGTDSSAGPVEINSLSGVAIDVTGLALEGRTPPIRRRLDLFGTAVVVVVGVAEDREEDECDVLITERGAEDFERAEFEAVGGFVAADGTFGRVVACRKVKDEDGGGR